MNLDPGIVAVESASTKFIALRSDDKVYNNAHPSWYGFDQLELPAYP
jgi:hypothetical protein